MSSVRQFDGTPMKIITGAIPSLPDLRDYNNLHPSIVELSKKLGVSTVKDEDLPNEINLKDGFPKVRDQKSIGACTAFGVIALLEYMELAARGEATDLSEMFLYHATRWLLGWEGDTGAYIRTTMKAMRMIGIAPQSNWDYDPAFLDRQPDNYVIAMARNYRGTAYFRHDGGTNTPPQCALISLKRYLAAGIPSVFGFYGFGSFSDGGSHGDVPLPGPDESAKWAHAVTAVGYADDYEIESQYTYQKTKGAVMFRNSWGSDWGRSGYGWIPYEYFYRQYCWDMWSILSSEWVDSGVFGI